MCVSSLTLELLKPRHRIRYYVSVIVYLRLERFNYIFELREGLFNVISQKHYIFNMIQIRVCEKFLVDSAF